jgi:bacteriocin-like protein
MGRWIGWMEKIMNTNTDRELAQANELRDEELEQVVGGDIYVEVFGHKVTTSDVADAAKWVWNKLF